MKKAKRLVVALFLTVLTVFGLQAFNGDGDACGCIEDCDRFCKVNLLLVCDITYSSGHVLSCPQMGKKIIPD